MKRIDVPVNVTRPRLVKALLVLVAVTAVLSLLYAVQYYAGGPLRLAVISEISDIALSPDKALLAAGARDGAVRVWDVPRKINTSVDRKYDVSKQKLWPVRTLSGSSPVVAVAFTTDGAHLLAVTAGGQVRRWSVDQMPAAGTSGGAGETLLTASGGPFLSARLSADRRTLALLGQDGSVQVWDLSGGRQVQSIPAGPNVRRAVAISADGSLVAAGDGANIRAWDVQTGTPTQALNGYWEDAEEQEDWLGHEQDVTALAFSPNGKLLASGGADTAVVFWDLESAKVVADSEGHWAAVTAMVFDAKNNLLLSGGRDSKSRTFKLPGGKSTAIFEGHLSTINAVSFGPQTDLLFTAGDDGSVRTWETGNQYTVHLEWARFGLQSRWGRVLSAWLLASGLLSLLCLWGLWRTRTWGHLLSLLIFLVGPIVVLGLPLFEVLYYPLSTPIKLQIAWPLLALLAWYILLLIVLVREPVALLYEAPRSAALSEQLTASRRTVRMRLGIYGLAVWILLLVVLYSVLRRFNLDVSFMGHFLSFIMAGASKTFYISAVSIALAVILALLGALGRLSRNPLANGASGFYVSLIRGTPLLVQIYIWYLGLPRLNVVLPAEVAGILALGVNYGAYMTEIFRAGIQAIGKGQYEAAEALGMSRGQTFRRIVLPQAFRIVIPPIGNEFIAMMKDSSLVSVMAVWELTYRAQKLGRQYFRNMETFIIAAAFYWILTVVFQFLQGKLEEYMARGERR